MEEAQRAEGPSLRSRQGSVEEQMSHLKPDLVRMSREKVLRHDILGRRYHLSQVTEEHMAPLKNLNLSPTVNNTLAWRRSTISPKRGCSKDTKLFRIL